MLTNIVCKSVYHRLRTLKENLLWGEINVFLSNYFIFFSSVLVNNKIIPDYLQSLWYIALFMLSAIINM